MTTLTVTERGQITIRKEVLQHLGIKPGDKIDLDLLPGGKATIKAARRTGTIDDFLNLFTGQTHEYVSDEDLKAAIEKAWAGER
jgi:AbrB family looped-hinge helix DNA binding protein